jgi:putative ABC transport system permease protein
VVEGQEGRTEKGPTVGGPAAKAGGMGGLRLSSLDRKLVRDLRGMLGQGITIALVVAAGIGGFIALRATFASLQESRDTYYERYRFGDVFAQLERAPEGLASRIEAIPGVALAYTRVVEPVRIPLEGVVQSPVGQVVTLPPDGNPPLNGVLVREGRLPQPGRDDEALLLDAFAERWGFSSGDTLRVVMNGSLRPVLVTGLATSPEFVYPIPPGGALIPDDERFAVLWMDRRGVAPVFRMEGAFNDVVLRLNRGASEREVLARLDDLLEPFGGRGSVGRDLQASNFILDGELDQLRQFATVVPIIFLGVAAFLLNVVLSRLLHLQRTQVAALKALGYRDREIGLHFLKMVSGVVMAGSILGVALGAWLGGAMTELYGGFFGFPVLEFRMGWGLPLTGVMVALAAGGAGAFGSLRKILSLSPAEAMNPEPPARYRPTLLERLGLGRLVGPGGRMVLREVGRRPVRTGLSALGIAMAVGILVVSRFSGDALEFLIENHFYRAWRESVTVAFTGPVPERGVRELLSLPGVERAEGIRVTAARMHVGHRWRDVPLLGYPDGSRLRRLMDDRGGTHPLPNGGVVITDKLGEVLGVEVGDTVRITLREGRPGDAHLVVTGTVDEMFGLQGHMRLRDLNALLGEEPRVSQALLSIEAGSFQELERRLSRLPVVADVGSRDALVQRFREQSGELLLVMTLILTIFATVIAAGVVYNNARVAVSMRERDLASLRVLGFTRREISVVLLGEMAVQVLLAIPLGLWIGQALCEGIAGTVDPERYRLPLVLSPTTYGYAVAVVLLASLVSALLVRRRLDHLDLIGVLKTRE